MWPAYNMSEGITAQYKLCQQRLTKHHDTSHTNSHGVGAGINMQPAYLSSADHVEPVFIIRVGVYR